MGVDTDCGDYYRIDLDVIIFIKLPPLLDGFSCCISSSSSNLMNSTALGRLFMLYFFGLEVRLLVEALSGLKQMDCLPDVSLVWKFDCLPDVSLVGKFDCLPDSMEVRLLARKDAIDALSGLR